MKKTRFKQEVKVKMEWWKRGEAQVKSDWCLTTPGVVQGLRYTGKKDIFIARVVFAPHTKDPKEPTQITDTKEMEWALDEILEVFNEEVVVHVVHHSIKMLEAGRSDIFVPLPNKAEYKDATNTRVNGIQINQIRYVPQHEITVKDYTGTLDKDGNSEYEEVKKIVPAKWQGLIVDNDERHWLTEDWVIRTFGEAYADEVKERCKTRFIPVSAGGVHQSKLSSHPRLRINSAPPMKYLQGKKDLCLMYSTASVLYHIGWTKEAQTVARKGNQYEKTADTLRKLHKLMIKLLPKWMNPSKIKRGFDWTKLPKHAIAVVILEGKDGSANHGVCIYNGMVFDSNEPEAINLSTEALQYCLDPGDFKIYHCIHAGYYYHEQGKQQKFEALLQEFNNNNKHNDNDDAGNNA